MGRTKPSKQFSQAEIERFLAAAKALPGRFWRTTASTTALREVHEPLLKAIVTIQQEG